MYLYMRSSIFIVFTYVHGTHYNIGTIKYYTVDVCIHIPYLFLKHNTRVSFSRPHTNFP